MCLWEFHPAGPRRGGAGASCGRACSFHIRACATEYSDPARGARPARAAGVCSPRLVVTFFLVPAARGARLAHTNLGPAGARPLSRFRIDILRVWHAGLPMAMLHASMLPGFVVHAPWHSLASPRGRMCSELGRGLAVPTHLSHHAPVQGRAQGLCEGRCQPTISTDTTTDGHIDAEHGDSQQRSGSGLLCGRGDQIERLHGPFQRRLQVFVPILLKCGAKDGEDGGLPLSVCCGYRPNHGRACSLS